MAIISVPKSLREKLGEEGSDDLIELLNRQTESERDNILEFVEEKFERRLSEEMAKMNERISQEIGSVNDRISQEIGSVNERIYEVNERITQESSRLEVMISSVQTNLIKWMFLFWIGQVGAILGILFAFFR